MLEIVIDVHAFAGIPQEAADLVRAVSRAQRPCFCFSVAAKAVEDLPDSNSIKVEKRVQTDRIVMTSAPEGAETV